MAIDLQYRKGKRAYSLHLVLAAFTLKAETKIVSVSHGLDVGSAEESQPGAISVFTQELYSKR